MKRKQQLEQSGSLAPCIIRKALLNIKNILILIFLKKIFQNCFFHFWKNLFTAPSSEIYVQTHWNYHCTSKTKSHNLSYAKSSPLILESPTRHQSSPQKFYSFYADSEIYVIWQRLSFWIYCSSLGISKEARIPVLILGVLIFELLEECW